jgi:hypothetical protein
MDTYILEKHASYNFSQNFGTTHQTKRYRNPEHNVNKNIKFWV